MYLRFVVPDIHPRSQKELGVLKAAGNLRNTGKLAPHEIQAMDAAFDWFNKNLRIPTRFTRSRPSGDRKKNKAISWFKDTAHEHLGQIRLLVTILENHGVSVTMLKNGARGICGLRRRASDRRRIVRPGRVK